MVGSSRCGQANLMLLLDEDSRASNAANRSASYGCFSSALGLTCVGWQSVYLCALFLLKCGLPAHDRRRLNRTQP